jgi:hypothetical protein
LRWMLAVGAGLLCCACSLSPEVRTTYRTDLEFASSIRGKDASPLHRQIFGDHGLDGKDYVSFFLARVQEVKGEGVLFASCRGAFACNNGNHEVRLSTQYVDARVPRIIRLSLLIHEARHSEGWPHEICPSGPESMSSQILGIDLHGKQACDPGALGAYGVQFVMLKNIQRFCETCSRQERTDAGKFADSLPALILEPKAKAILLQDSSF